MIQQQLTSLSPWTRPIACLALLGIFAGSTTLWSAENKDFNQSSFSLLDARPPESKQAKYTLLSTSNPNFSQASHTRSSTTSEDLAPTNSGSTDTTSTTGEKVKKVKKGWTFGAVPAISFDTDLGLQYGALVNLYDYGDGSIYPTYRHSIFAEASWKTKGSGIFRLHYDSRYLIPNTRLSADISFLPDYMCDFSGFNGYEAVYRYDWMDSKSPHYVSRAFYKIRRDIFRAAVDIERAIVGKFKYNLGAGILDYYVNSVDIDFINKGKAKDKLLPDTSTLYDYYTSWNLIKEEEKNGGTHPYLRGGFTYDSRNKMTNPSNGIWADAFLTFYPGDHSFCNLNLGWRQYINLVDNRLNLAYRVYYQQTIIGESPFYIKNYMNMLFIQRALTEAMGGASSLRGITRNRAVGDGYAFTNIELRWTIYDFTLFNQYFYVGLNPFTDIGYIVKPVKIDRESIENSILEDGLNPNDFFGKNDGLHISAGCGIKIGWNENFVISADWAKAINAQDGNSGIHVLVGYIF